MVNMKVLIACEETTIILVIIGLWFGVSAGIGIAEKDFKDNDEYK